MEGNPQQSSSSTSSGGQHMLSEKVTRALQVRTDTTAMKAALDALAGLSTMTAAALSRTTLDSTPTSAAADKNNMNANDDSTFPIPVDARSVRVAIEQDALQQALALKQELQTIVSHVRTLRSDLTHISQLAATVQSHCHPIGSQNHENDEAAVATQLAHAFAQRSQARKRSEAVHAFMEQFDLSPADSRLLDHYQFDDYSSGTNNNMVNGKAFLAALERVHTLRTELTQSSLDNNNNNNNTTAFRMMEHLAHQQERAYERLYHWFQQVASPTEYNPNNKYSDEHGDDDDESVWQHDFVQQALYTLRHVPAFYAHCTELVAHRRRSVVTKKFLWALTAGPAPLELKAHDPVAYVGDMLAFTFTTFSVEGDVARSLLEYRPSPQSRRRSHGYSDPDASERSETEVSTEETTTLQEEEEPVEGALTVMDVWAMSLTGMTRPLKSRIVQVIATLSRRGAEDDHDANESDDGMEDFEEEGTVFRNRIRHLYEICGLLLFYTQAIQRSLDKRIDEHSVVVSQDTADNPFVGTLKECLREATEGYEATVRTYGAMLSQLGAITGDSEATQVKYVVQQLREVRMNSPGFTVKVSSQLSGNDPPGSEEKDEARILSMDWNTTLLVESALQAPTPSIDDILALQDTVTAAQSAGLTGDALRKLQQAIHEKESKVIEQLVQNETQNVLDLCGLKGVADSYRRWSEQAASNSIASPMASFPGLSKEVVAHAIKDFYASLYSPPLPSLETTIKDPMLRKSARSQIAQQVVAVYGELYEALHSNANIDGGYGDVSFLQHSPQQVETLFSV